MPRYVILAIGFFNYIHSKTGNMLIRYCNDKVVAIIDPQKAGKTANSTHEVTVYNQQTAASTATAVPTVPNNLRELLSCALTKSSPSFINALKAVGAV